MKQLLFDGVESKAFNSEISLKCSKCSSTTKMVFRDVLKNSKSTNQKNLDSNFLYESTFTCKNKHKNKLIFRFEEVQPARYQIEKISIKHQGLKSKLKHASSMVAVFLLLAIIPVFVVWVHATTYQTFTTNRALRADGALVSATVTAREGDAGGVKRAASYELTYEYQVGEALYSDTKKVDQNTYALNDIGDSVNILYDKNNPNITDVESNEELLLDVFLIIVLDISLIAVAIWIYKSSKQTS